MLTGLLSRFKVMKRVTQMASLTVMAVLLVFATGCNPFARDGQPGGLDPKPNTEEVTFSLYFVDDQAMNLVAEPRTVAKGLKPLAELMIEELIQGPQLETLDATIPAGVKLLSQEVADGVALVNFSREMQSNHSGGTTGEAVTMYSVVYTLTELPEIDSVQFLIEGEKQEAIWGHVYTMGPVKPEGLGSVLGIIKE